MERAVQARELLDAVKLSSQSGGRCWSRRGVVRAQSRIIMAITALLISWDPMSVALAELPKPPIVTAPRLYILDCGTITNDRPERAGLTREEVKYVDFAVTCYLIVHPKGILLWDTGLPDSIVGRPLYENMLGHYGFLKTNTLVGQLADLGYRPDQINYLAMSHLHVDHSGNANLFSNSTWLVAKPEYDSVFSSSAQLSGFIGYENLNRLKDARKILVGPDYDVFGDGAIIIKQAFGHTAGHSVLAVHLVHTGWVLLAGDLYHYPEERALHRIGAAEAKTSAPAARAAIETWIKDNNSQIWLSHDMEFFKNSRHSPAFYE